MFTTLRRCIKHMIHRPRFRVKAAPWAQRLHSSILCPLNNPSSLGRDAQITLHKMSTIWRRCADHVSYWPWLKGQDDAPALLVAILYPEYMYNLERGKGRRHVFLHQKQLSTWIYLFTWCALGEHFYCTFLQVYGHTSTSMISCPLICVYIRVQFPVSDGYLITVYFTS